MAVAEPLADRWLYGPGRDLLFGCGLLYALLFAVFAVAGPGIRELHPPYLIPLLMVLVSTPHYGATLLRVYEHAEDRRAYAFFTVWVTIALCIAFVLGVYVNWVGTFMLTLYLTWSPWHYTGQNYGIAVMFLRRRGIEIPEATKKWLYASFILSYVLLFLVMHGRADVENPQAALFENGGVHLAYLGLPEALTSVAIPLALVAYLVALAGTAAQLLKLASARDLLPVAMLCLTQALWFSLPEAARYWNLHGGLDVINFDYRAYYFSWIVFGHAAQYLWITAYFAKAKGNFKGHGRFFGKALLAGNVAWMLPALCLTPDGIGSLSYDLGLGMLVAALVNLHHFVLDGAIWKLRSNRVASILIRSTPSSAQASEGNALGSSWRPALAWGGAAILLLGTAVELYESQWVVPAALEREDFAAASASLDRMAWFAKDPAQGRAQMGSHLLSIGRFDEAQAQYERSLALQPGVEAHVGIGQIHAQAGRWPEALSAYEAALMVNPDQAGIVVQAGIVQQSMGNLEDARQSYERALTLWPDLEAARKGLEQVERMQRSR